MKLNNILIGLTVLMTVFSCQKDFEDEFILEGQIIELQDENHEQALLIEHLQEIINAITGKLDNANKSIVKLQGHLDKANDSIQLLNVDIDNLYELVDRKEAIIDSLLQLESTNQETIDVLTAEVDSLNESIETVEAMAEQYSNDLDYLRANPITITVVEYVMQYETKTIVETRVVTETIMMEAPATPAVVESGVATDTLEIESTPSDVVSPVVEIESTPVISDVASPVISNVSTPVAEVVIDNDTDNMSDTGVGEGDDEDTPCEAAYDQTFYSDNLSTEVTVLFDCNDDWAYWRLSWITDGTINSTTVDRGNTFEVPWTNIEEDGSLAWITFLDANLGEVAIMDEFQLSKLY